ncbi:hypothetical protein Tco_0400584 [Tanacetum coccineum]
MIHEEPTTENTNTNQKPKYYDDIDETIHKIHKLGLTEYSKKICLEESEMLDEIEFWLSEKYKSYSKEFRDFLERSTTTSTIKEVDDYRVLQILSYDPGLAKKCSKVDPYFKGFVSEEHKAFIKSVEDLVKEGRKKNGTHDKTAAT